MSGDDHLDDDDRARLRAGARGLLIGLDCILCSAPMAGGDIQAIFMPPPIDLMLWGGRSFFVYHVCGACEHLHGGRGSVLLAEHAEGAIAHRLAVALGEAQS